MAVVIANINVPILTANNYNNWRFRIIAILKKEQCENVIDEDIPTDPAKKKEFMIQDAKAQSFTIQAQCPKRFNRGRYNRGRNRRGGRGRFNNMNQEKEQANSAKENIVLVAANFCNQKDLISNKISNKVFVLDCGASNHFVKEELEKYMVNVKKLDHAVAVHIANGQILEATKQGEIRAKYQGKSATIDALIVPGIKHNLLSAAKLTSKGHWITRKKCNY
ncbi:hypothetical protein QE152_g31393 [Popillia japonica]|uniref:Retrovirus-related Pol polyprotein from transposon TNT 1-94-like beta-barrel domain-containing protein n=1 Tax=Popillia japonica TaxID=7064 RepID=A0AAW1J296_POPJA